MIDTLLVFITILSLTVIFLFVYFHQKSLRARLMKKINCLEIRSVKRRLP